MRKEKKFYWRFKKREQDGEKKESVKCRTPKKGGKKTQTRKIRSCGENKKQKQTAN